MTPDPLSASLDPVPNNLYAFFVKLAVFGRKKTTYSVLINLKFGSNLNWIQIGIYTNFHADPIISTKTGIEKTVSKRRF